MEPANQPQSRKSRWSRDPILVAGKPAIARLTDRDLAILALLARFRYLPADDIHAFVGGSFANVMRGSNCSTAARICSSTARSSSAITPTPITGR